MFGDFPFKVIDDFLPIPYWERLNSFLCSSNFPWFYQKNITDENKPSELGCFGFNHWVLRPEESVFNDRHSHPIQEMILPFCYFVQKEIGVKNYISNVRCDMSVYNPTSYRHKSHVDLVDCKHIAVVYYVNDSDGSTIIYNKQVELNGNPEWDEDNLKILVEIKPKPNRVVMFDGSYVHTGHSPSKTNSRVIINSDYLI